MGLRTLSFSVSSKSFACHSYEICRGVYQQFPFWNSSRSTGYSNLEPLTSVFSHSCELFCTHEKLNSFVFMRFHTLSQKQPGVGVPPSLVQTGRIPDRI